MAKANDETEEGTEDDWKKNAWTFVSYYRPKPWVYTEEERARLHALMATLVGEERAAAAMKYAEETLKQGK